MLLSNCATCGNQKSGFIKKKKSSGLLSEINIRTPLRNIPLLDDILF